MIIKASTKYIREGPSKIRPVARLLIGLSPQEAIFRLSLIRKRARKILIKLVRQGMANAKNNFKIEPEGLKISKLIVNEGPRMKRYDKSHGARFDGGVIKKKFSHIYLILETAEETSPSLLKEKGTQRGVRENGK